MGGSKTTTTSNSTNTQAIDPRYDNKNWELFGGLQNAVNNYNPVLAPQQLPFNPTQIQAQNNLMAMGNSGNDPYISAAGNAYQNLANYNPMMVGASPIDSAQASAMGYTPAEIARSGIRNITGAPVSGGGVAATLIDRSNIKDVAAQNAAAAQMTGDQLRQYVGMMDPTYQNAVLDQTRSDIERQRMQTQNQGAAAAAAAGAFGGSRHGVADAETNRAYGDTFARTSADLRLAGYNAALQNLQADLGRQQQTGMFNSDAALRAAMANQSTNASLGAADAQNATQAGIAGAQNALQASIASANNSMQAQAANQGMDWNSASANAAAKNAAGMFGANAFNNNSQYNAGLFQDRNIFNANQAMQAGLANQSAGLNAANIWGNAAGGLMNVGNNLFNQNVAKAGLLGAVGDQQYGMASGNQAIDYQNAQYLANLPLQEQSMLLGAFNSMPYGQTQTSSGTTVQQTRPSLMSTIGQGLSLASNFIPGGSFGGLLGMSSPAIGSSMASLPLGIQPWAGAPAPPRTSYF